MSRLIRLSRLTDKFDQKDCHEIDNYFIGALAVEVDDAVWDECLRSAESCALAHGLKLKDTEAVAP